MENYSNFNSRPHINDLSRQQQQDLSSSSVYSPQAQLPSFREIIPPLLHSPSETQHHSNNNNHNNNITCQTQPDILTPISQTVSCTSRSIATSPSHSQSSSMPSLTEGFEDISVRGHEAMFATPAQPMATMDRNASWMPTSQYQNLSTGYTQPTQRMSQMGTQQLSSRTSPNLPPLRDINQRSSGFDQTYATTNAQMTYVTQAGAYPQLYSSTPQTTTDIDNSFNTRNLSYDGNQYARFTATYPQTSRSYQTNDYSRFSTGTTTYDPYRYNGGGGGYRASYGDMNYSPHPMVSSQPASFGVPGDMSAAHSRRRRGNLPKPVTDILRSWFHDHLDHPYPTEEDKQIFIQKTGLTISQISNWFINARRRHWPALRQNRDRARTALRRSNSAGGSV